MRQNNRTDTTDTINELNFGGFAYRKQLRYRVALLTGLVVMRDELNTDIAEMTGQLNGLESESVNGAVRKKRKVDQQVIVEGRAVGLLPAADAANAATTAKTKDLRGKRPWTAEQREAMRQIAIARWNKAKALGNATGLPKKADVGTVDAKAAAAAATKQAAVKPTASAASKRPGGRKASGPAIGFHTNYEFLYEFAAAHNGLLSLPAAKASAAKSKLHKSLAVGGRMSVAIAEMMRKGFMAKEGGPTSGTWRLLPAAKDVYERERGANQSQNQSENRNKK